jgi:hypothetical protein
LLPGLSFPPRDSIFRADSGHAPPRNVAIAADAPIKEPDAVV